MDRRLKLLQRHSRPITLAGDVIPHAMAVKILRKKRKYLIDRKKEVSELEREFSKEGSDQKPKDLPFPSL